MKIYLIRHGQTDANISDVYQGNMDVPLNETGIKQAWLLGQRLKHYTIDVLYSSHLKRAHDTAKSIIEHHEITPIIKKDLQEINLGEWQGKSRDTVKVEYQKFFEQREKNNDYYDTPAPGGESFSDLLERSLKALRHIIESESCESLMIVTHGGVIKSILTHILDLPFEKHRNLAIHNTSITTLKYIKDKDRFIVLNVNDTNHLEK